MKNLKISRTVRLLVISFVLLILTTQSAYATSQTSRIKYNINTIEEAIDIIDKNLSINQNKEYTLSFTYQPTFKTNEELDSYIRKLIKSGEKNLSDFNSLNIYESSYQSLYLKNKNTNDLGLKEVTLKTTFKNPISEINMIKMKVKEEIIPKVKNQKTNYEKVKLIYRTTLGSLQYNQLSKNITNEFELKESLIKERNILVGLNNEGAVCETYSFYLSLLLSETGFENRIIRGKLNDGPHAWNKVNINGHWYNIDSTAGDISMSTISDSIKRAYPHFTQKQHNVNVLHNYQLNFYKPFLVSDKKMASLGYVEDNIAYPKAINNYPYPDYNSK